MARQLARLLGRQNDKLLLAAFEDLEKMTGSKSIDVKLLGEILEQAYRDMRILRLDSRDTTAKELYHALRVNLDSDTLDSAGYVGVVIANECISFNTLDLAADEERAARFEQRSLKNMRSALVKEIEQRYLNNAASHENIVKKLLKTITVD